MDAPNLTKEPPRKILLATDLSARCDRALDRAARLAMQWQSDLVVLHVLENADASILPASQLPSWRRSPDPLDTARKRLIADVEAVTGKAVALTMAGDPTEAILHASETGGCDLIVVGLARDRSVGRFGAGNTVGRLLRRSRTPLLVVKARPRNPYRRIVIATDFSDPSRFAVEAATRFFPGQGLTVFHAYNAPMAGLMANAASHRREYRKVAAQACEAFLEKVDKPEIGWQPPHVLVEDGAPTGLLRDYVCDKDIDLVVLGTHGRSAIFELVIGSIAKRIMHEVPCDALVIRAPRAQPNRHPALNPA